MFLFELNIFTRIGTIFTDELVNSDVVQQIAMYPIQYFNAQNKTTIKIKPISTSVHTTHYTRSKRNTMKRKTEKCFYSQEKRTVSKIKRNNDKKNEEKQINKLNSYWYHRKQSQVKNNFIYFASEKNETKTNKRKCWRSIILRITKCKNACTQKKLIKELNCRYLYCKTLGNFQKFTPST